MTRFLPFRPRGTNWPCSCISMTFSLASGGAGGPTAAQGGEPRGDRASGGAAAERGRARRAGGQGTAFRKAARSRPGPRVIGMGTIQTGESTNTRIRGIKPPAGLQTVAAGQGAGDRLQGDWSLAAARGEPGTTVAATAKRGRLRVTAASYVLVRGALKTSARRFPRDMRVHNALGCSRRGLTWHRP